MARMPRGEPRSVPDPAGDQYDAEMAQVRAQREAEDRGFESPLDMAQDALEDFQNGPKIARPNAVASFIPVIGPAWEAAADLQDGNYGGAVFNAAMAAGDLLPVGAVVKGARAARKGIGLLKRGSVSADAARKAIRGVELAGKGEEIHHTIPLKGLSRNAQDWRNHYPLLKVLPKATHRRLTGKWDGMPRFDPIRQVWHGTTDWQKTVPTAIVSSAADAVENVMRPFQPPPKTPAPQPKPKPKK